MTRSPLDRAIRKIYWRYLPIGLILFTALWSDQSCLSLAKLKMAQDLSAFRHSNNTETIFGLSQALYSVGILTLQIPSITIVEKWSAYKWFSLLSIVHGFIAILTAFVTEVWQIYLQRFLLGVAGSGFFTGILIYLSHWLPLRNRGIALSIIFMAVPIAYSIGPKISYLFIRMGTTENGIYYPTLFTLRGWQWLFVVWGIISILLSIPLYYMFTDRPSEATWLTKDEHDALHTELAAETKTSEASSTICQNLCHLEVLLLCIARTLMMNVEYGFDFFIPTMLDDWYHLSDNTLTWLLTIPGFITIVLIPCVGWSSDYFNERFFHTVIPLLITIIALAILILGQKSLIIATVSFVIVSSSLKSSYSLWWILCTSLTTQEVIASESIGIISVFGDIGESTGPFFVGLFKDQTGSFTSSLIFLLMSAILAVATMSIVFVRVNYRRKGYTQ
ncbi:unnamed protein product [Adineta steineri]|uniref:Major facilitator superfamily (MFS) profile domain-containing protein n=1 Tax=Adineta steineri TaxID=433720 RepID=A0A819ND32_9BILA|nr:unnamed protein product [Adineta steineri]